MTDGYIRRLKYLNGVSEIVNLSAGGTTSLTAIGRLYSESAYQKFDLILYEYSINDTGHFFPRIDGATSWMLAFQLLIETCAKLHPNAVFLPILLSEARFFHTTNINTIYDAQIEIFNYLQLQFIDVRQYMYDLFGGNMPAWLYKDGAHYSKPFGTDLIGAFVVKKIETTLYSSQNFVKDTWHQFFKSSSYLPISSEFLTPARIFDSSSLLTEKNSLMTVSYRRLEKNMGIRISLDAFPLALFIKSDAKHAVLNVGIDSPDFLGHGTISSVSTCHADTNHHKFIYTSIPIPFLFSQSLLNIGGATTLEIFVPTDWNKWSIRSFDAFIINEEFENYCDLAGILTVKKI